MIYIYWTPIARSIYLEKPVCLIRIYKIFSEYKRRLISTHIYFSNVLLLTKIYAQVVISPIFVICDIAKDSIGFKFYHKHQNIICKAGGLSPPKKDL